MIINWEEYVLSFEFIHGVIDIIIFLVFSVLCHVLCVSVPRPRCSWEAILLRLKCHDFIVCLIQLKAQRQRYTSPTVRREQSDRYP